MSLTLNVSRDDASTTSLGGLLNHICTDLISCPSGLLGGWVFSWVVFVGVCWVFFLGFTVVIVGFVLFCWFAFFKRIVLVLENLEDLGWHFSIADRSFTFTRAVVCFLSCKQEHSLPEWNTTLWLKKLTKEELAISSVSRWCHRITAWSS